MEYIIAAIGLLAGLVLGLIFSRALIKKAPREVQGALVIDRSDPDGPFLFLELHSGVERIEREETVLLKVEKRNYLSQD